MEIRIANEKDLSAVFALRIEVFVREQRVPLDVEIDSEDADAVHFIADENGTAVGCARVIISGGEAHIGRLVVKSSHRGQGIGAEICKFVVNYCREQNCTRIWLNSQLHAAGFYEKLGFSPRGESFYEAGIKHIMMEL